MGCQRNSKNVCLFWNFQSWSVTEFLQLYSQCLKKYSSKKNLNDQQTAHKVRITKKSTKSTKASIINNYRILLLLNSNSVHKNASQSITITLKTYSQNAIFTYENCNYTSFTIKMQIKKAEKVPI